MRGTVVQTTGHGMQMPVGDVTGMLDGNPFAMLTAIVAPAVLTNASSVLSLGTSNRLARVVDRTRQIAALLSGLERSGEEHAFQMRQMDALHIRGQLLFRALRSFYGSLGGFAASALLSLEVVAHFAIDIHATRQTGAMMVGRTPRSAIMRSNVLRCSCSPS